MTADRKRVSIGFPVYNGESYMRRALDSLRAQTYTDFELTISDNCSTDRTRQIGEEYAAKDARITYCRQEKNIGSMGNFKFLLEQASREYFFWACYDDQWDPRYVEEAVRMLDCNPGASSALGVIKYVDVPGTIMWSDSPPYGLDTSDRFARIAWYLCHPIPDHLVYMVFRRTCFSGYQWSLSAGWEKKIIMRIVSAGPIIDAPSVIFLPQITPKSREQVASLHQFSHDHWDQMALRAQVDVLREIYDGTSLTEFLRLLPVFLFKQGALKAMLKYSLLTIRQRAKRLFNLRFSQPKG